MQSRPLVGSEVQVSRIITFVHAHVLYSRVPAVVDNANVHTSQVSIDGGRPDCQPAGTPA